MVVGTSEKSQSVKNPNAVESGELFREISWGTRKLVRTFIDINEKKLKFWKYNHDSQLLSHSLRKMNIFINGSLTIWIRKMKYKTY